MNQQQLKAATTIDTHVAVNAGAGTGKTTVLTDRYIYLLENGGIERGKEIESIVAITFTKKATQEMIARIRREIRKNFYRGEKWTGFYRDMEKAHISTIHSFCGMILRENPIESNLDPLFQVLDDNMSRKLLCDSIIEVLNESLEDKKTIDLMLEFNAISPERAVSDMVYVYNKIRTFGMMVKDVKDITIDHLQTLSISEEQVERIKEIILYLQTKLRKNSKLVKLKDDIIWQRFVQEDYEEGELSHILEHILENVGESKDEPQLIEELKILLGKASLLKDRDNIWIYEAFMDILENVDLLYREKKDNLMALDYDDLQERVLRLLDNPHIVHKYRERFKYIMIDEFQDTNELQKKIFYKLLSEDNLLDTNNLFVVGDPKQSIYGFRGADMDVFQDVIEDIRASSGSDMITLFENYRSSNTILAFINDLFEKLMGQGYISLKDNKVSPNPIDVELLQSESDSTGEDISIIEADLIAKRIKRLVDEGEYSYGDIAMLFRAGTRNFYFENALKKYNIPFYNFGSKQFYRRQEILDLINCLKAAGNPYDTIAAIGFLRGPMAGLSDNTIYHLIRNMRKSVYAALTEYMEAPFIKLEEEEHDSISRAKELLDYIYSIKDICDISYMVEKIIYRTNFIGVHLLKQDGKRTMSNIQKFMDIIYEYEEKNISNLEHFIDYIEEQKIADEAEGRVEEEGSDVVKLMTIHSSKGLQFPVVIIPEMSRQMNLSQPRILVNKDIGLGIRCNSISGKYNLIKGQLDTLEKEEQKRLLYVAMTRSERMLILGNEGKAKANSFKGLIDGLTDENLIRRIDHIDMEIDTKPKIKKIHIPVGIPEGKLNLLDIHGSSQKIFNIFSISQYLSFSHCRRKFYFDYYKKMKYHINDSNDYDELETAEDKAISSIDRGNIAHEFAKHYKDGMDKEELLENIFELLSIPYNDKSYDEVKVFIDNYIFYVNKNRFDKVYIEKPFYIKLGEEHFTGVIDRINIIENKIHIVDLKTNRVTNTKHLMDIYKPQLLLYAYVAEKIMKMPVSKISLLFLQTGKEIEIPLYRSDIEENIKRLTEFTEFVHSHSDLEEYEQTMDCASCKHSYICNKEAIPSPVC